MSQEMVHSEKERSRPKSQEERSPRCSPKTCTSVGKNKERKLLPPSRSGERPHPQATLAEIEQAVDEQMNRLRARMIEQAAQTSAAAESEASQGLMCEQCGQTLQARGRARRRWQTQGGQQVEVERTYVTCPQCGGGFFPPGSGIAGA